MTGPDATLHWEPEHRTDVALTLGRLQHGRSDPVHRAAEDGGVWRTVRTPDGAATLRVSGGGGSLRCDAWGPGAGRAVALAPDLLGARDDPTGFEPRHPLLERAHRRFPGLRIARTGAVFEALVGAALEQRVVGVDAIAAWNRLVRRLGEPAPGPAPDGMRVFPAPTAWLGLSPADWHRADVDPKRAATVRAAATVAPSLERLLGRPAAEAGAALRTIRGVGAWTAAEVRQRAFGDADAVSVGDAHLAGIVGQSLAGRPFDDAELVAYLAPWRPHRYRVARLLYALGIETLPRHGPRPAPSGYRAR